MKSFLAICASFLAQLLISGYAQAQQKPELSYFEKLGTQDGLPSNSILSIGKDSKGFMWFGTYQGLSRYDSRKTITYTHDSQKPGSISNDIVQEVFRDKQGVLWLGTAIGLNRFDPVSDEFEQFYSSPKSDYTLSNNVIQCIFQDSGGTLWIGTSSGLNKMVDRKKGIFQRFFFDIPTGRGSNFVRAICEDSDKNLWIGTENGLFKISSEGVVLAEYRKGDGILDSNVKAIVIDDHQMMWIGTRDGGITRFDYRNQKFASVVLPPDSWEKHEGDIFSMTMGGDGNIWTGTAAGLWCINTQTYKVERFINDPDNPENLSDNAVLSVFQDENLTVWVGTYNYGVNFLQTKFDRFKTLNARDGLKLLTFNGINSMESDADHNLYLGTDGGGLNFWNMRTGHVSHISRDGNLGKRSMERIRTLHRGNNGLLWVGAPNDGLSSYNPNTGAWKTFRHSPTNAHSISSNFVNSVVRDRHNRLWVLTDVGLDILDQRNDRFHHFARWRFRSSPAVLFQDSKMNIWVGGRKIVYRIDADGGKFQQFEVENGENIASDYRILCFAEDQNGGIWAGGFKCGLRKFSPEKAKFISFTYHGYPEIPTSIFSMEGDQHGRLWLGTHHNLAMINIKTRRLINFGPGDGIHSTEFLIGSSLSTPSGDIYFGTNDGLLTFNSNTFILNQTVPTMTLTQLSVNNKVIRAGDQSKILKSDISYTREIELQHLDNSLRIDFAALNFIDAKNNVYAYKMEGWDKQWMYSYEPFAVFNSLPPGTYKFMLRGSNNDNLWSAKPIQLKIHILPPWWERWWAYLIYAILFIAALLFVIRLLLIRAELKNKVELNQAKMEFFTNVSHEIRTHLTLILVPLERSLLTAGNGQEANANIVLARNSAGRLLNLVTELLDFRKIENDKLDLRIQELDVVSFIRNILPLFEESAQNKVVRIHMVANPDEISLYFDPFQLEKVIFNLLSNAFKFVENNGNIWVEIGSDGFETRISITDDGRGILPKYLNKIFENYFQSYEYEGKNTGYGIGLSISKRIVELHHGSIEVTSEPGISRDSQRTCFKIVLRNGSGHFEDYQKESGGSRTEVSENHLIPDWEFKGEQIADSGETETILIVEDNDELRQFIASCFSQYKIIQCSNGREAWDKSIEILPDLIIADVMLPVEDPDTLPMDGVELCRNLKFDIRTSHIPVILLTAKSAENYVLEGLEAQADHYITKPFNLKELELKIENLLRLRNAVRLKAKKSLNTDEVWASMSNSRDKEFLETLANTIRINIDDSEFGADALAREVGVSRTILFKKVKAITGMSVNEFAKIIRIDEAEILLKTGIYNVTEVSEMVGFADRRYFSKEFARMKGKTPAQYIKDFQDSMNSLSSDIE